MEVFNIEDTLLTINKIDNIRLLVNFTSILLHEKEKDLIAKSLYYLGRDQFINLLIQSLCFINRGGIECKEKPDVKRSYGGVLFYVIKTESGLTKKELKNIFSRDYNLRNQKRIIKLKMNEMEIS